MNKKERLLDLFITTFLISASTSGGYAIISMMKDKYVNKHKWLSEEEMLDLLAIAQSCPGPIAINASVLVGYKVAGVIGAIITIIATALPPLVIMSIIASFYSFFKDNATLNYIMKGMLSAVSALLLSVSIDLFTNIYKQNSIVYYLLFIISFILVRFTNINILLIALLCAITGIINTIRKVENK